ncbi:MAG: cyanophycin synthetase [Planctomycetota bacterium]
MDFAFPWPACAHLVGIGGAGMSGLARLLRGAGVRVSGSDSVRSPVLSELDAQGIATWTGSAPERVPAAGGWVVRSAAVPREDPEVLEGARRGLRPLLYAEAVGLLTQRCAALAVAGAHGKTTTTALLTAALRGGGIDASHLIGGDVPHLGGNGRGGRSRWLAVEACEFNRSFHALRPAAAAVLNLDHDHFDCYPTPDDLIGAYAGFAARVRAGGLLVVPVGAPERLQSGLGPGVRVQTVGVDAGADLYPRDLAHDQGGWSFRPCVLGETLPRVALAVPGRHQVDNALAALALALWAGAEPAGALDGIGAFRGVRRRFEMRTGERGTPVVDDYGHHPTELSALVETARHCFPGRRLVIVFQPHQHQRTSALLPEFAAALARFDVSLIADIYGAREGAHGVVSAEDLVAAVRAAGGARCAAAGGVADLALRVADIVDVASGRDVVLMVGAGDIDRVIDDVAAVV